MGKTCRSISFFAVLCGAACGGSGGVTPVPTVPTVVTPPAAPLNPDISGLAIRNIGVPVEGATVDVLSGSHVGTSITTDANGRFLLVGVQGPQGVTIRVSKPGSVPVTLDTVFASRPDDPVRVVLWPSPGESSPKYTVSLSADPACDTLPADARTGTYLTSIQYSQEGIDGFDMPLEGANFYPTQRVAYGTGTVAKGAVAIALLSREIYDRWLEDGPIVENLGGARYLAVSGSLTKTVVPPIDKFTATFEGTFSYCERASSNENYFECAVKPVECHATQHQLTLTPR